MLGIYFAPLIALTKVAVCKIPFTASENKLLWGSIDFCWTLNWVQVWEEAKWNWLNGLWCVRYFFTSCIGGKLILFYWLQQMSVRCFHPQSGALSWPGGCDPVTHCSLHISFKGSFLFSWKGTSCQWWTCYKKIIASLVISHTDLCFMSRCFLLPVTLC